VPAAAVIPAPMAYVKVAAVKKLVVECWDVSEGPCARPRTPDASTAAGTDRPARDRVPGPFPSAPRRDAGRRGGGRRPSVGSVEASPSSRPRPRGVVRRPSAPTRGARQGFTLKKLGCSKRAERRLEYISMG